MARGKAKLRNGGNAELAGVVDTDVFSFVLKNDTRRVLYEPHLENQFLFLSFMSLAELHDWTLKYRWGFGRIASLENALKSYSIQHSTREICSVWAEIVDDCRKNGKPIKTSDAWVAATAISLDVPLISHNAKDFKHIRGLNLITENK